VAFSSDAGALLWNADVTPMNADETLNGVGIRKTRTSSPVWKKQDLVLGLSVFIGVPKIFARITPDP
jgi:hypothetical protein